MCGRLFHRAAQRRLVLVLIAFALCAEPLQASPIFKWLDEWNVTFDLNMIQGDGDKRRAFGAAAVNDLDILGTTADLAVARAKADAFTPGSFAEAQVDFQRKFSLSGNPTGGWVVNLQGILAGTFSLTDPNLNGGQMLGFGEANLFDVNDALLLHILITTEDEGEALTTVFEQALKTIVLDDGEYRVEGYAMASARVFAGNAPGAGQADFFSNGNWTVGLSARPIPEPGTLLLLSSALAALSLRRAGAAIS
jgi:PEP-CTERM motif